MNENEDIVAALEGVQEAYQTAREEPRQMTQLPSGSYLFRVTNAFVGRSSGAANRLQLRIDLEVLRGPTEKVVGRSYFKTWGLVDAEGMKWLTGDLLNLGFELPDKVTEIPTKLCPELIGICFEATVRPAKDPTYGPNVWIPKNARRTPEGDLTEDNSLRY